MSRDLRKLGLVLAEDRAGAGFSLRDVEKRTGITASVLSRLETGQVHSPNPVYLSRLAVCFEKPVAGYLHLAGYDDLARFCSRELPGVQSFLRQKLGFSADEAERADEVIQALASKWKE